MNDLTVSPSPHIHDGASSTRRIMLLVLTALLPACIAGTVIFGGKALLNLAVCTASAVFFEFILRKIMKRPQTVSDLSAAVTGLLLGMNLPPEINPLYGIVGAFAAIAVAKQLFGGIGQNFANPAIFGRIVLMLSFTAQMSSWSEPFYYKNASADAVTCATPLVSGNADYMSLFLGVTGGCIGETCAAALIIGGFFLIFTGIITPHAPFAFIGTTALLTFLSGNDPLYAVLSGGLLLGAFFMATDYATTPLTGTGKLIFGIGCGIITFAVRQFGNYPEGVSFSILLMNLLTPYIDKLCLTVPAGAVKKEGKKT